jgi:hypothetical protein
MKTNVEIETPEQVAPQKAKTSGNPYEVFRDAITATVLATIMRVRDVSVSYNWSIGRVITACAEACKIPTINTPEDFKRIVKFEVEKLRSAVATNDSWELTRSREDFVMNDGLMKGRLTNVHLKLIPLESQLVEARRLYSRLGNKLSDETLSAEKRTGIRKRMQKVQAVIDHTSAEIERQKALQAEAAVIPMGTEGTIS